MTVRRRRIPWVLFGELVDQVSAAAKVGPAHLEEFTLMLARDFRDHVEDSGRRRVQGNCPWGCGETLFLSGHGVIECVRPECVAPVASTAILWERETEHVVTFGSDGYQAKHPLRERVGDALLGCDIGEGVQQMLRTAGEEGKRPNGRFRIMKSPVGPGGWAWQSMEVKG